MAKKWQSSPHTIADIREWNDNQTLLLQPDYQRREVWGEAARIMLIDSILNDIPMPKIFVSKAIKDKRTYRSVIDGQQRISTILSFLNDGFKLEKPYQGEFLGKTFSELPEEVQNEVLLYSIDFNEASGLELEELREVYSRVNKYLVPLNKQELRKADFPGDFLKICEELANLDSIDELGLFSATARRRSLDVEYIAELVASQLRGISDKKDLIDECCRDYADWPEIESKKVRLEFENVVSDISKIFNSDHPIRKTRWRQKADFYSLFLSAISLRREGFSLPDNLDFLRKDLLILDKFIAPTSEIPILSKYAIYCVSQANSMASRSWRTRFIRSFLRGTYARGIEDEDQKTVISEVAIDFRFYIDPAYDGEGCPPARGFECEGCGGLDEGETSVSKSVLYWPVGTEVYQLSNSRWAHIDCKKKVQAEAFIDGSNMPGARENDFDYESDE